jgi:hypothetical protein
MPLAATATNAPTPSSSRARLFYGSDVKKDETARLAN